MYNFQQNQNPKCNVLYGEGYTKEQAEEIFMDLTGRMKCVMSVVNNAAYTTMMEAIDNVKQTPYFRGKIKQLLNKAIKAHEDHERDLKWGNFQGIEFFEPRELSPEEIEAGVKPATKEQLFDWYLDIGACAYKRSVNELEMLRYQVLQAFTKHDIKYRKELSYVCVANAIIEYSCQVHDQMIKEMKEKTHIDFGRTFRPFRMSSVFACFDEASKLICTTATTPEQQVDLNNSENIRTAFRVFENVIMQDLNTMESADEAIEQNKFLLSPEAYKAYREKYDEALEHYNNDKK